MVTLVSGGGSENRSDPGRALHDPRVPFSNSPRGWVGPLIIQVLWTGGPLLPGADGVGGGPHARPVVGDIGQGQPGRNGASHALTILRPGQHILDQPTSLLLPG